MCKMRIGITGPRGLLGTLLSDKLAAADIDLNSYDGDITDTKDITGWIKSTRPQVLLHLAAIVPVQRVLADPARAMKVNGTSLLTLAEAVSRHVPECWLFLASSSHVYGTSTFRGQLLESSRTSPQTLYGATKLAGEQILIPLAGHLKINLCVGRIFSYFHELQPLAYLVPNLAYRIIKSRDGDTIEIRDADSIRDFLHADMVVDAILHLCARQHGGIVNIASGRATSVGELAGRLISLSGKSNEMLPLPSEQPTRLVANVSRLKSVLIGEGCK